METILKEKHTEKKDDTVNNNWISNGKEELQHIHISNVAQGKTNYRKKMDEKALNLFSQEIAQHGILSPLLLRPTGNGQYEVVAGERRYKAAKMAGLEVIPAIIRKLSDQEVIELQLVENLQRENPHPMYEGKGISQLIEDGLSLEEVAKRLGKSKAYIYTRLKLVQLLPELQEMFLADKFNFVNALSIAELSQDSQDDLLKMYCKGWKKKDFKVHNLSFIIKKYKFDLHDAPFNIKDETIKPEAGACGKCPFNSATLISFFPDMEKSAVCTNKACYREKTAISLESSLAGIIKSHAPKLILCGSSLSAMEKEVIAKFPELKGLNEKNIYEVDRWEKPKTPSKITFQTEDSKGKVTLDKKAYNAAIEEYKRELDEFNTMLKNGTLKKAVYINHSKVSTVYYGKGAKNTAKPVISARQVQEAIKNGTITRELLEKEIERLNEKEKRSKEIDREKVQIEVYEQFRNSLKTYDHNIKFTTEDQVSMKVVILYAMPYTAMKTVYHTLFPKIKNPFAASKEQLYAALEKMDESLFTYMIRQAISGRAEGKSPKTLTGLCLYELAESSGIDVEQLEQSQNEIETKRVNRLKERIMEINAKIKKL